MRAIASLVILLSVQQACDAVELIANGGFESGQLLPWYQNGNNGYPPGSANWSVTTLQPRSGSFSATISINKPLRQDFAATPTSNITSATFWMRNTDRQESAINIRYSDNSLTGFIARFTSTEWTLFDITSQLAANKSLIALEFYGNSGSVNDMYLDDVSILAVPEPSSLVALGLGSLIALKRRVRSAC